jgi:hypothetical protein
VDSQRFACWVVSRMAMVDADPVASVVYMGEIGDDEMAQRGGGEKSTVRVSMYHERNIQPASKLSQIMILRTWRGGSKSRWPSVERETKRYIMAWRHSLATRTAKVAHRTHSVHVEVC